MDFFNKMKDKVEGGVDSIRTGVSEAVDAAADLPKKFEELKDRLIQQAKDFADEKQRLFQQWKEEKEYLIKNLIRTKLERLYDHAMNVVGEHFKEKVKDPYMPQCIQGLVDDTIDGLWPDVKLELKDVILTGISGDPLIAHGEPPSCPKWPIAWLRYSLLPYDRTIWRQLRNVFWWLFQIASLFPLYAIGQMVYILYFFLLDCGDEYQLQMYILDFKAMQFFTLGILSAIIGAVEYYICTSGDDKASCSDWAPQEEAWVMLIFVLQVVIVWIAFLLLRKSTKKGGFYHQLAEASAEEVRKKAGTKEGRLHALDALASADPPKNAEAEMAFRDDEELSRRTRARLMGYLIYDFIIFLLCVALVAWMMFCNFLDRSSDVDVKDKDTMTKKNWKFAMTLYWIKAFYGLMSFPFALLKVPVISWILSHARPTGYNPYGNTVRFIGREGGRPGAVGPGSPRHTQGRRQEEKR